MTILEGVRHTQNICPITFIPCWDNIEDVEPGGRLRIRDIKSLPVEDTLIDEDAQFLERLTLTMLCMRVGQQRVISEF